MSDSDERRINIIQGEYQVSADAGAVITTMLGSCVAACLHDPLAKAGGMNHFLLAGGSATPGVGEAERHGVHLMELLVNGMLKLGASRDRLRAKLFGGARAMHGLTDIGAENARFARAFLAREGIAIVGVSLGGEIGRRIQFWPASGRARQLFMSKSEAVPALAARMQPPLPPSGDLELF